MHIGKVVIAGAGPGDPELLTLKTAKYLHLADVVLTDRLVSKRILEQYVNPIAEIVFVGKEGRKSKSTSQNKINTLLVAYASQGKLVVRLKGGDVSFFSNVLDELETLKLHNIPYELIPGITAGAGAAAYAGIPLTARGYARAARFLTYFKTDTHTDTYWKDLATTDDTLVFYMSGDTLQPLAEQLLQHGIAENKGIAVIEQATTPYQRVFIHRVKDIKNKLATHTFVSPTLLIVGDVVHLHRKFGWKPNSKNAQPYFTEIPEEIVLQENISVIV